MLVFLWEHSLSHPGLAALTHENFASVEDQDFTDCLTLMLTGKHVCYESSSELALHRTDVY